MSSVADLLTDRVSRHLEAEARAVRMPRRQRARVGVNDAERSALAARLGSAGANLVPALDDLEEHARRAERATGLEPNAVAEWQYALNLAARRLEEAWLELEETVERESATWMQAASRISAWRRPVWPVVVGGSLLLAAASWLGLVLGGYVEPPQWLTVVWSRIAPQ